MLTFRPCDESNLGVSGLCDLEGQTLFEPTIWGKQVSIDNAQGSKSCKNSKKGRQIEKKER